MAKLFRIVLTAVLLFLPAPLLLPHATTAAHADTWEHLQRMTHGATSSIWINANADQRRFEGEIERRRGEILQKFNFHKGNAAIAIKRCDRAFYEGSKSAVLEFRDRKRTAARLQIETGAREISELKARAAELNAKYEALFAQIDALTITERITTGRHKELLGLAAAALVKSETADAQLETAQFKNKQLNKLNSFFTRSRWEFPDYPEECTAERYGKADEKKEDDSVVEKTDPAAGDDDGLAMVDYCAIVSHPDFQSVCYDWWRILCRDMPDPQKQARCNETLQPGGPRYAGGKIWDFCAFVKHSKARLWCYEGFRKMVRSACGTIDGFQGSARRDCMNRAALLPSNLPAPDKFEKTVK